jgi:hypothetical protein
MRSKGGAKRCDAQQPIRKDHAPTSPRLPLLVGAGMDTRKETRMNEEAKQYVEAKIKREIGRKLDLIIY